MALRLWDLTKVLLLKRDLVHLELASVQIFEDARVAGKVEAQAVGVERLMRFAIFAVHAADAVFAVAEQGMAEVGHARADLMRAAREQLDLQK